MQERTTILDSDFSNSNTHSDDDYEWINYSIDLFFDKDIEKNRNRFYQKQIMNKISSQVNKTISYLNSALKNSFNYWSNNDNKYIRNFMLFEKTSIQSLQNNSIQLIGNAYIHMPSNFDSILDKNSTISIQVCFFFLIKRF